MRGITTYIQHIEATGYAVEREEQLTPTQHLLERVMLGLRQRRGLCAEFLSHPKIHKQYIAMANQHLLERTDNRVRLTRRGLLLADLVCTELIREL